MGQACQGRRRPPHAARNAAHKLLTRRSQRRVMLQAAGGAAAEAARIDGIMERLSAKKGEWAALPVGQKVALLQEVRARLLHQPLGWARASAQEVKKDSSEVGGVGWRE